jgi:hypothetical protein
MYCFGTQTLAVPPGNPQVMAPVGQQQQEKDKLGLLSPFSPVFDLELEKKANSGSLERCCSEHTLAAADAAAKPTLFQQILQLCRCTTPVAAQVSIHSIDLHTLI